MCIKSKLVSPHFPRDRDRDHRERAEPVVTPVTPPVMQANIDTGSVEQFPRLSATPAAPGLMMSAPHRAYKGIERGK